MATTTYASACTDARAALASQFSGGTMFNQGKFIFQFENHPNES